MPTEQNYESRKTNTHCKRILESGRLDFADKIKVSITSRKLVFYDASRISSIVLNYALPSSFNIPEDLPSVSDKARLFVDIFF